MYIRTSRLNTVFEVVRDGDMRNGKILNLAC